MNVQPSVKAQGQAKQAPPGGKSDEQGCPWCFAPLGEGEKVVDAQSGNAYHPNCFDRMSRLLRLITGNHS